MASNSVISTNLSVLEGARNLGKWDNASYSTASFITFHIFVIASQISIN
jgi:hypothetical protein